MSITFLKYKKWKIQGSAFNFMLSDTLKVGMKNLNLQNSRGTCSFASADRRNSERSVTMQEELSRKIYMFQFQSPVGCNSHNLLVSVLGSLAVSSPSHNTITIQRKGLKFYSPVVWVITLYVFIMH